MYLKRAWTRWKSRARDELASVRQDVVTAELEYDQRKYTLEVFADEHLGNGAFTVVCKGKMVAASRGKPELPVAVKIVNFIDDVDRRLLEREIKIWQRLNHPNVQPLYGISTSLGIRQFGIVSPLADNGNMMEFIVQDPTIDRLPLLQQVATGLKYLHLDAKIVHGDLKCTHILITREVQAKISGFRLGASLEEGDRDSTHQITQYMVALAFAAPELLKPSADKADRKVSRTTSSDVFAFGRLVYEAYAAEQPWVGIDFQKLLPIVLKGEPPPRDLTNPAAQPLSEALWQLCNRCWKVDPSQRPNCDELLQELEAARQGESQTTALK